MKLNQQPVTRARDLKTILCDIPLEQIGSVRFVSSAHVEKKTNDEKNFISLINLQTRLMNNM